MTKVRWLLIGHGHCLKPEGVHDPYECDRMQTDGQHFLGNFFLGIVKAF